MILAVLIMVVHFNLRYRCCSRASHGCLQLNNPGRELIIRLRRKCLQFLVLRLMFPSFLSEPCIFSSCCRKLPFKCCDGGRISSAAAVAAGTILSMLYCRWCIIMHYHTSSSACKLTNFQPLRCTPTRFTEVYADPLTASRKYLSMCCWISKLVHQHACNNIFHLKFDR